MMTALDLTYLVTFLGGLWLVVFKIKSHLAERRFQKFARDHGAVPAAKVPYKLPGGLDIKYRILTAVRRGLDFFDDIQMARCQEMGVWTFEGVSTTSINMISTAEPENMKALLATKFNDFAIGPRRRGQFGAALGKGIFNLDGPEWAHARALFRPMFSRDNINDLQETERATKILLDVIPGCNDGWTSTVDLMPLFYRFTLDTATAFLFGESLESQTAEASHISQNASSAEFSRFSKAFTVIQEYISLRIKLGSLYWLGDSPSFRSAVEIIRRFTNQIIRKTLARKADPEIKQGHGKYSIVEELTKATDDAVEIRDNVIAVLAAGRDTTSALLSWLFYLLATHPRVFNKLRNVVIEEFGESPAGNKKIGFAELKSCRYLQYVISETLRLYPTVPANMRYAVRDTLLPVGGGPNETDPIAIRKGQTVAMFIYPMHRRPDIWGEDADQFKPERFENRKSDWSFIPFSGGPRICLGQQYAITEASYLTVRLLQTFDAISWEGEPGKPKKGLGITLFPADGTTVKLRYAA